MSARRLLIVLSLLGAGGVWADADADRGLEIALEADRRDTGYQNFKAELTMLLRNKHGEESLRNMRTRSLEVEGDGDKTMIIFDQPRDVEGNGAADLLAQDRAG